MHPLLFQYPIISDQVNETELSVILRECTYNLGHDIAGDIVEMGCYGGTTSLFLRRLLVQAHSSKQLHVYDSFMGLPAKSSIDNSPIGKQFQQGELSISKAQFMMNFKKAGLTLPIIHSGWFAELKPADIPGTISFAFLDGDFYESILASLALIWPNLSPGAIVIIDDYQSESLPGVQKAVDRWLLGHVASLKTEASLALLSHPGGRRNLQTSRRQLLR